MTDKKDGPGKGPERSAADGPNPKRPFATIDLKATEVPSATATAKAGDGSQGATAEKIAAASRSSAHAAAAMAAAAQMTSASGKKPAAAASDTIASDGAKGAAARATPAGPMSASQPRSGSGFGRFVSYVVAGIAGGVLALLGQQFLALGLGSDGGRPQATSIGGIAPDHAARLNVLEKQVRERLAASAPTEGQRAADAGNLARLEEMAKQLASVSETQTKIAAAQATLKDDVGKLSGAVGPSGGELVNRIAGLEEQLATMARAASANPESAGRLPQLAQLTGQISDLRAALDTRLQALRKDLIQEIQARTNVSTEAAEAAKAGTKRIDGEVAQMKTDTAKMSERIDLIKAGSDKVEQTLKGLQDEAQSFKTALDGVKTSTSEQIKATAKPTDIALAVTPLATKVTALETSVQSVIKAEEDRKSNAERIVLSLELGNLKRAMDRGHAYAPELAEVKKVAGNRIDVASLEKYQNEGVPSMAELTRNFGTIANAVIDADSQPADGTVVDRLISGAKSVVRVRKTTYSPNDNSAEAVVARMEAALKEQRLQDVIAESQKLSQRALKPAQDWLRKVDARRSVDVALAAIDQALKSSLGAGPASQKGAKQ